MKYLVDINNGKLKVLLEYNKTGLLVAFRLDCHIADEGLKWLHKSMPFAEANLMSWKTSIRNIVISEAIEDTSFNGFWERYKYKVGNKKRAEKLWNLLTEKERLSALASIAKYDRFLATRQRMEKAYPETYLAQRRWENEYK